MAQVKGYQIDEETERTTSTTHYGTGIVEPIPTAYFRAIASAVHATPVVAQVG